MKNVGIISIIMLFITACSIKPEKINYGFDACHYCKMTIVDAQHASEMVTAKGKVYKYDAIECMINDINERSDTEIGLILVANYNQPGELIEAETATFLISEKIPSPMGAFLSAFNNQQSINGIEGKILSWKELQRHLE